MPGCFGNHPVDRWMEGRLNAHLDSTEMPRACEDCEENGSCVHENNPYDCGAVRDPREP